MAGEVLNALDQDPRGGVRVKITMRGFDEIRAKLERLNRRILDLVLREEFRRLGVPEAEMNEWITAGIKWVEANECSGEPIAGAGGRGE